MSSPLSERISLNDILVQEYSNSSSFTAHRPDHQNDNAVDDDVYDLYDSDSRDVTDPPPCDIDDEDWIEPSSSPNCSTWAVHASRERQGSRDWMATENHRSSPDASYQEELGTSLKEELSLLDSECTHRNRDNRLSSRKATNREPTTLASGLGYGDEDTRDAFDDLSGSRASAFAKTCRQSHEKRERKVVTTTTASAADSSEEDTWNAFESNSWNSHVRASREEDDSSASDEVLNISARKQYRTNNGIPLLFKKLNDTPPAFWEVCMCCAEQHIAAATHESPLGLEVTRKGFLRVTVETTTAASILQDMDNLGGIPVEVVLPRGYSDNVAKISNVPLVYTDAQIRKFFAPAGVVAAKRQVAYRTQQDGSIRTIPRDSILLTFRPEREIPVRIRPAVEYAEAFDYRYFPVRLHVTTPTQCYNCFRYGHMAKHCRRRVRCKVCAGDHSYKDCVSRLGQRCANCDGPHAATYGRCPARLAALRDKRYALRYDRRPLDGNYY